MGRRNKGAGCGCVALLVIGLVVYGLIHSGSGVATIAGVAIVVLVPLVALIAIFSKPSTCQLCSGPMGKKSYTAEIEGKKLTVCSKCGNRIHQQLSRHAVNRAIRVKK